MTFDVNDLAFLFPSDQQGNYYPNIKIDDRIWPKVQVFDRMMAFAKGDDFAPESATNGNASQALTNNEQNLPARHVVSSALALAPALKGQFGARRVNIGTAIRNNKETTASDFYISFADRPEILDQSNWRIVSMRFDLCAAADEDQCDVELRLIAQPLRPLSTNEFRTHHDFAAHLIFHIGSISAATGEFSSPPRVPVTLKEILHDLQKVKYAVKQLAKTEPIADTDGVQLSTHPALALERTLAASGSTQKVGQALTQLIAKYTAGGVSTVTTAQIANDFNPWVFFQGRVINQAWVPIEITGNNQQFSIAFAGHAGIEFLPKPLSVPSMSDLSQGSVDTSDPRDIFKIDNPGRYGIPGKKTSVKNIDCASCHTTSVVAQSLPSLAVNNLANLYVPLPGITGYPTKQNIVRRNYDIRNFGYSNSGSEASPMVMSRTVNEAAEVAGFSNRVLLPKVYGETGPRKNPGFVAACEDGTETRHKTIHAKIWDCLVTTPRDGLDSLEDCAKLACTQD